MRVLLMVLFSFVIPTICSAGIAEAVGEAFGVGKPGRPVVWLLGLSIGGFIIMEIQELLGRSTKGVKMIIRCAEVGIVIAAVYGLLNTAFNLIGL